VVEALKGATLGWRKLGLVAGVLLAHVVWLVIVTLRTPAGAQIPDLPMVYAGAAVALVTAFMAGNWGEHRGRQ